MMENPETKSLLQMFNLCIRDGQQTMTATMPLIFFVFFTPEDEEQLLWVLGVPSIKFICSGNNMHKQKNKKNKHFVQSIFIKKR